VIIATIYPPPSAKEILYIHYCMNLDRILLLLEGGAICIYHIDPDRQNTGVLEKF
jgi:hypothetical protein